MKTLKIIGLLSIIALQGTIFGKLHLPDGKTIHKIVVSIGVDFGKGDIILAKKAMLSLIKSGYAPDDIRWASCRPHHRELLQKSLPEYGEWTPDCGFIPELALAIPQTTALHEDLLKRHPIPLVVVNEYQNAPSYCDIAQIKLGIGSDFAGVFLNQELFDMPLVDKSHHFKQLPKTLQQAILGKKVRLEDIHLFSGYAANIETYIPFIKTILSLENYHDQEIVFCFPKPQNPPGHGIPPIDELKEGLSKILAKCQLSVLCKDASELISVTELGTGHHQPYRVVFVDHLPYQQFLALTASSNKLSLATGDQSTMDALALKKIIFYEILSHKENFATALVNSREFCVLELFSFHIRKNNQSPCRIARLLREEQWHIEYEKYLAWIRSQDISDRFASELQKEILTSCQPVHLWDGTEDFVPGVDYHLTLDQISELQIDMKGKSQCTKYATKTFKCRSFGDGMFSLSISS